MKCRPSPIAAALLAVLLLWTGAPLSAADSARERGLALWASMPEGALRLEGVDGEVTVLRVRVADTPRTRAQGMQYLTPEQIRAHPIWFVFETPQYTGWHMNNVQLALDIVFVDRDGRVIGVQRMQPGQSGYGIDAPISAALELAAGQAERYGLAPGARITPVRR
jgi:uncharacterized membrane protein (UPF0127 family)